MGIPVVRVGTGLPVEASRATGAGGHGSAGDLADLWYPSDERTSQALANGGVPAARIHYAGNLFIEAVQIALRALQDPMCAGAFHRMVLPFSSEDWSYALVLIEEPKHVTDRQTVVALIAFLRRISRSVAVVLLMRSDAEPEFNKHRLHREIFGERLCHLPAQAYANQVELLRNATCVLTDSRDVREEAIALEIPCLAIGLRAESPGSPRDRAGTNGGGTHGRAWASWPFGDDGDLPDCRDGLTGARIAEHLCAWLRHLKPRPSVL